MFFFNSNVSCNQQACHHLCLLCKVVTETIIINKIVQEQIFYASTLTVDHFKGLHFD